MISKNIQFEENVIGRFKEVKKDVKAIRDALVHRGRVLTNFSHKGKFYIPLKVTNDMVWSSSMVINDRIEATKKLNEDIMEVEKIINELHECIISEYEEFIRQKGIRIEYIVKE